MLFTIECICNSEIIPKHVTRSLGNPWHCPGALCSNHTHTNHAPFRCLLPFVSTYLCEHAGLDIRGGERETVTSLPHYPGTLWEFRTYFLPGFFRSSTEFILKRPNRLSQVGEIVQTGRVVNTVSTSFTAMKLQKKDLRLWNCKKRIETTWSPVTATRRVTRGGRRRLHIPPKSWTASVEPLSKNCHDRVKPVIHSTKL